MVSLLIDHPWQHKDQKVIWHEPAEKLFLNIWQSFKRLILICSIAPLAT